MSYPKVSAVVGFTGDTAHVAITLERPINGYYGGTLEVEVHAQKTKADRKAALDLVQKQVAWKVRQETSMAGYPAEDMTLVEVSDA